MLAAKKSGCEAFQDIKRGFLSSTTDEKDERVAHGFPMGTEVEAHSLQTASLNGARGCVKQARGDRVVVAFPAPIGEKALKPDNLRLTQTSADICANTTAATTQRSEAEVDNTATQGLSLLGLGCCHPRQKEE